MNSTDIVLLKLPPLPTDLRNSVAELCKQINYSNDRASRISSYYPGHNYSIAAQEYGTEQCPPVPRDIIEEFRKIYGDIFQGGIMVVIGGAKNVLGCPSVTPPHCDRLRRVAINYLLDLGGHDVITTVYHEKRRGHDLSAGENLPYDVLTPATRVILEKDKWHAFDPQHYHSVENITETRYYLSLHPIHNFTFDELLTQYSDLVV